MICLLDTWRESFPPFRKEARMKIEVENADVSPTRRKKTERVIEGNVFNKVDYSI